MRPAMSPVSRSVLYLLLALAGTLVLAAAVATRPVAAQSEAILLSVELPDAPGSGVRLFAQKGCSRCHSVGGGGATVGPDLGRLVFSGTALDLAGTFWNHAPLMREKMAELKIERPTVTNTEMATLIAFLTAYRYYDTQLREPGNPALGRNAYVMKGCAGCHDGKVGMPGPDLRKYQGRYAPIFLAQAMWNHGPEMAEAMRARGVPFPTFAGREMTDLTAYLQQGLTLDRQEPVYFTPGSPLRGRDVFLEKRCTVCHAVGGQGGGQVGPDLGLRGRELRRSVPEVAGAMWNHSVGMNPEFVRRGVPRVMFTGQEMADVIAYLYFINFATVRGTPSRGGEVFVNRCSACHTLGRQAVGPDLTAVSGLDQPISIIATMWNHAIGMEEEHRKRKLTWPQFEQGEVADLAAFLISYRRAGRANATPPK